MAQKALTKVDVACPHCASTQKESPFAKTTICRNCTRSYSVEVALRPAPAAIAPRQDGVLSGILATFTKPKFREICCFECGHRSQVSRHAKSSICPKCSSHVDLQDIKITSAVSRNIRTHGTLKITARGDYSGVKGVVNKAIIDGKMSGNLSCKEEVIIRRSCKIRGKLSTARMVIGKRALVEFLQPVRVRELVVLGALKAQRVFAAGKVDIGKRGELRADVHAKGFVVAKGGEFYGNLKIGQAPEEPPPRKVVAAPVSKPKPPQSPQPSAITDPQGELGLGHETV